jgi:hypothetical protein
MAVEELLLVRLRPSVMVFAALLIELPVRVQPGRKLDGRMDMPFACRRKALP